MKNAPWFKFYPADFMGGVVELSSEERGSYITLLCAQWSTGSLPPEHARLERIAGGPVSGAVRAKFEPGADGRLRNSRLESHREEATAKSRAATGAAVKRWDCERKADAMQTHSGRNAEGYADAYAESESESESENRDRVQSQEVSPLLPVKVTSKTCTPENTGAKVDEDFESFWKAYPRKAGKAAAHRAWKKAKMKPVQETILAAVESAKRSNQWQKSGGEYIPHPATWINQGRWHDVHEIAQIIQDDNAAF